MVGLGAWKGLKHEMMEIRPELISWEVGTQGRWIGKCCRHWWGIFRCCLRFVGNSTFSFFLIMTVCYWNDGGMEPAEAGC